MKRFEYRIVSWEEISSFELKELGNAGWELIVISKTNDFVFKRPIEETGDEAKVVLWKGHIMKVGKCTGVEKCLACDRIGEHLELVT